MDEMSARQYRTVGALALATAVGLSLASCSSSKDKSGDASGKTTIVVDCPPLKTDNDGKSLAQWNADVTAFQKLNPNITVKSISVGSQCDNPPDFTARLQGGTEADVFYGYMTDLSQVLDAGQAEDVTSYVNASTVPYWDSMIPSAKAAFTDNGKLYAVPYSAYTMGLVVNKGLFQQAGLDPTKPPATWQEVAAAAKKISALGNGIAGYEEYSAGNTGGWHFTAELYSRGGQVVSDDGKTAGFNNDSGKSVLQNLHDMRFTDNSVGTKQLLQWPDLLTNAAAGKVGMYIGAPDSITAIVKTFHGKFSDWAMGPMPGDSGPAKATLGGGNGYFLKKGLTPAQIKAGIAWVNFEELTPGQGQFNYVSQKSIGLPVGLPQPQLWVPGSDVQKKDDELKKANSNLDLTDYAPFANNPVTIKTEPPQAQAIYAVLDSCMSAVLTKPNANITDLLKTAESKVNTLLSQAK
jgi:ABC-type glycerol-3-phosphate transport system substrate-binding protein